MKAALTSLNTAFLPISRSHFKSFQSPTNPGLSFGVVNCLVVFPNDFITYNSILIIL